MTSNYEFGGPGQGKGRHIKAETVAAVGELLGQEHWMKDLFLASGGERKPYVEWKADSVE